MNAHLDVPMSPLAASLRVWAAECRDWANLLCLAHDNYETHKSKNPQIAQELWGTVLLAARALRNAQLAAEKNGNPVATADR